MKIISFSAVEILPSLLDKSKTQTIRPLIPIVPFTTTLGGIIYQKPRFKVGDKAKLMWKQRSKYRKFCSNCGGAYEIRNPTGKCDHLHFPDYTIKGTYVFDKILGIVEIIETFEIEMVKKNGKLIITGTTNEIMFDLFTLSKRDGFVSYLYFEEWFDKKYDLSTPKRFAIYRWNWL